MLIRPVAKGVRAMASPTPSNRMRMAARVWFESIEAIRRQGYWWAYQSATILLGSRPEPFQFENLGTSRRPRPAGGRARKHPPEAAGVRHRRHAGAVLRHRVVVVHPEQAGGAGQDCPGARDPVGSRGPGRRNLAQAASARSP